MTVFKGTLTGRVVAARIRPGRDLLDALEELVRDSGFRTGLIEIVGSVRKARLSCYHQARKEYVEFSLDEPLEIVTGLGNVSLRDGKPFVHVHLTLSDESGKCYGGHLVRGTETFVAEVFVSELATDPPMNRTRDDETGLLLWLPY